MKRILSVLILTAFFVLLLSTNALEKDTYATTSEAYIPSETLYLDPTGYVLVDSDDLDTLKENIQEVIEIKTAAHAMAEAARALGYEEDHPVIKLAQAEFMEAHAAHKYYVKKVNEIEAANAAACATIWESEYQTAAYVWQFLDDQGFNDYIKAGIMGNLMSECGGQTLDLDWKAWSSDGYYGIIQWSKYYFPGVVGQDLEGQCNFLMSNIEATFNIYGKNYKSGFKYNDFLNLQNEKDAALAFAKCYERCSSASYTKRQNNATKAYDYFINK